MLYHMANVMRYGISSIRHCNKTDGYVANGTIPVFYCNYVMQPKSIRFLET